jgi:hypothetical protein
MILCIRSRGLALLLAGTFALLAWPAQADPPSPGQEDALRWQLSAGQKLSIEISHDITQLIDAGGGEQEVPVKFTMFMTWSVVDVANKEFKIEQTVNRIKLSMTAPMAGEVDYDSDSDETPEGFAEQVVGGLEPLVGSSMIVTMNERGQTVNFEVDPALLEKMKSSSMGPSFASEDTLKNMIGHAACTFPEEGVSIGKSWTDELKTTSATGNMTTTSTYTYDGHENVDGKALEKISVKSLIAIEPSAEAADPMEVQVDKQDNTGVVYFDSAAGHVTQATINQNMEMTLNAMGQEIAVKTKGKTTLSIKPGGEAAPTDKPPVEKSGGPRE